MKRQQFMAALNNAIEKFATIAIMIEGGTNYMTVSIVPHDVDEGERDIIIYSKMATISIDGSCEPVYNEEENSYSFENAFSVVTVYFD